MADNTASIGFEKQIWDAACVLRGNLDASEYKSVVLGLIFLKYISDRFDEKHHQLVEEGDKVVMHGYGITDPGKIEVIVVDIFRVEEGKLAEHWESIMTLDPKDYGAEKFRL